MNNWTREQTIIVLNVYCKIPFNKASNTNPEIVNAARLIGRTPVAVKMKVGNFGSFDSELKARGIVGLANTSKLDEEIWEEYHNNWDKLAYDSERIIANLSHKTIEESSGIDLKDLPEGKERESVIKQRINQSFFRMAVMSAYNFNCCISGVCNAELLEACHIVDWSKDTANRTNPKNGLCLNPFFHKAYDKNLMAITPNLEIVVSDELIQNTTEELFQEYLQRINGHIISLPDKFLPDRDLLDIHYQQYKK